MCVLRNNGALCCSEALFVAVGGGVARKKWRVVFSTHVPCFFTGSDGILSVLSRNWSAVSDEWRSRFKSTDVISATNRRSKVSAMTDCWPCKQQGSSKQISSLVPRWIESTQLANVSIRFDSGFWNARQCSRRRKCPWPGLNSGPFPWFWLLALLNPVHCKKYFTKR